MRRAGAMALVRGTVRSSLPVPLAALSGRQMSLVGARGADVRQLLDSLVPAAPNLSPAQTLLEGAMAPMECAVGMGEGRQPKTAPLVSARCVGASTKTHGMHLCHALVLRTDGPTPSLFRVAQQATSILGSASRFRAGGPGHGQTSLAADILRACPDVTSVEFTALPSRGEVLLCLTAALERPASEYRDEALEGLLDAVVRRMGRALEEHAGAHETVAQLDVADGMTGMAGALLHRLAGKVLGGAVGPPTCKGEELRRLSRAFTRAPQPPRGRGASP